jgi:hypothetical protein
MRRSAPAFSAALLLSVLAAAPVVAQGLSSSLGLGLARPRGQLGDRHEPGFTVRAQTGVDLPLVDAHLQAGWTRLPGEDPGDSGSGAGDHDVVHLGLGARLGRGRLWAGATAAYFLGDGDDGVGLVPEVGAWLGPLEAVLDLRVDGEERWWSLRGAVRF